MIKNCFKSYLKRQHYYIKVIALFLLLISGLMPVKVMGQQYPVKLVPVVIPPYSLRLADYATSTDNKLQLQVLMTDLLEPQHQTGIKFSLEAGLNAVPIARSNDFIVGMNPFTLYPGNNVTLTNVDLRSLFELQNLAGINAVQYSKPLADGVYQFCFQAYDYFTKNNLSSKTCTTVFMVQYDPPMLTLPQNAEKIQALAPYGGGGGVVFQWMPRQIAPNTRYIFTLKELWDQGQSPISGFLSAPPLWREETYAPTLYYGIDKTQLMPGKRYAWQVQAKSGNPVVGANATDDNGVYKNNGLSEIFYFDYVENCAVPTLLMAKNISKGRVEIRWSLTGQPGGLYNVQYRKKGSSAEWATQQSYQATAILTGLEDKTEYEYRVGTVCGSTQTFGDPNPITGGNSAGNAYSYSGIQFFTTDGSSTNNNYQCGIMPAVDIANKTPLQTMLGNNEVFTAGDFPVTVLSAQGSNGIYTGTGFIEVPYLADTKIKVSFRNIKLNTDKKLIEGTVETTYDINETAVHYGSGGLGETFGDAGVKEVTVDYTIVDIKYTATPPPGKIIVYGDSGNGGSPSQQDFPGGKDYEIKDKDGNIWTVDENGNVTKTGKVAEGGASNSTNTDGVSGNGSNAAVTQYTAKGIKIDWKEDMAGKFAYDTPEKTKLPTSKYPSVKDADNNTVYVPYKATVNKQTELFDARVSISDPLLKDGKFIFKTLGTGKAIEVTELSKTDTERNYQLKLPGTFDYAEEEVIAVLMPKETGSKQKVIGSFRLVHLSPEDINVSLVPLDAASQSNLQAQGAKLNQIYNKIGVKFNVKEEPVLNISSIVSGDTIGSEDSDLMSTYSPQQQQINALYKGTDARYVLFVTDKKSSTGQNGYMRLNGQFGFVYGNAPAKTGSHELGHGVFKLEHPWKALGTTEKGTNLLMDYAAGEELSHLDWKQINDPAFKLYAFQGQSAGELAGGYGLSPDFKLIKTDNNLVTDYSEVHLDEGFVEGFTDNNKQYYWKDSQYVTSDGEVFTYNQPGNIDDKTIIWLVYNHDKACNEFKFIRTKYSEVKDIIKNKNKDALYTYIEKIDQVKRPENPKEGDIYSAYFGCDGKYKKSINDSNGGGSGKSKDFFKNGNKEKATTSGNVLDFTGRFTPQQIQQMLKSISMTSADTGIKGRILVSDDSETHGKAEVIFTKPNNDEIIIWLKVSDASKPEYEIKINAGAGVKGFEEQDTKKLLEAITKNKGWFEVDEFWTMDFNPITAVFDGLAELIGKAKIPERFYNPDVANYNPIPSKIYSYINLSTLLPTLISDAAGSSGDKYSQGRIEFAFVCGVWNGLVDTAAGISSGVALISKGTEGLIGVIASEEKRKKFKEDLDKFNWSAIGDMMDDEWKKATANPCMKSYTGGNIAFVALSFFIGAGEANTISKGFMIVDRLDVLGQAVGKFASLSGRYIIKPVITKAGKFIIEPLLKLEPEISSKLRNNVSKYVAKLLNKDKIYLSLHATSDGGFIVDGEVLNSEQFGEYLTKKLSEGANKNKDIVLLSCNDLESAKALAVATGKKVYTTDGPMMVFENGIRRAEGSDWYQISPDGTSTKIQSPVAECTNCTGEGVEMGKSFEGNLDADVVHNLNNTLGAERAAELLEITRQLPSTWTIKKIEGKLVLVDKEGKQWAEILNSEIRATAGDAGQGWNKFLNVAPPLMKNFKYVVDNGRYVFETDELGRVHKAVMEDIDFHTRARNEAYQQEAKKVKDGRPDDDGGHIFRNEWGGPSEQINYFSQNAGQNRAGGDWYKAETAISDFKKANPNKKLKVEMEFYFDGSSKRPISTRVDVYVDGVKDTTLSKRAITNP